MLTAKSINAKEPSLVTWKKPFIYEPSQEPCRDFKELLIVNIVKVAFQKNWKRHFLRDNEKSFQEVTPIGPEPHQFFSFWNISTNMIARGIQNFGQNGLWLAGWLSNGKNFCIILAQRCDEQILKISRRYVDSYLS